MPVIASGPEQCKVMFVGMGPAQEEVRTGVPFMGPSGLIFNKSLKKLGYSRDMVRVSNIHDEFLPPGTSLFSLPQDVLHRSIRRIADEIKRCAPNVVVPLGDEPLYFLTGLRGITKWRGSIVPSTLVPGVKCVPSIHTAWIVRGMWKWEPVFTWIDLKRAFDESRTPNITLPKRQAITAPTKNMVLDFIRECMEPRNEYLSTDIETFGYTKQKMGEISCWGIGYRPDLAMCIPFLKSGDQNYWSIPDEVQIWQALCRLLQMGKKIIGQNLPFEWIYAWWHKMFPHKMEIDTMELHHSLYPDWGQTEDVLGERKKTMDEPGHGLAFIVSHYLRDPYYKDDGRKWNPALGDHQFWRYNCMDVMCTMDAAFEMRKEAEEEKQWDIYVRWKQRPFLSKVRAEWQGIAIDIPKREQAGKDLDKEIKELQDRINQKVGYVLNVNSPQQMQDYLYKKQGYTPKKKKVKKKDGTTKWVTTADKHALRELGAKHQDEVIFWAQELRQKVDLRGDIVEQQLGPDGRMHTHYGVTDTLRWTSSKSILGTGMNLQNIPVKGISRQLFLPD